MSVGALLICSCVTTALIDSGYGPVHVNISELNGGTREGFIRNGALLDSLTGLGVSAEDIDKICFTHLHGDHTGWLGTPAQPTFANARYLLSRREWQYWTSPESAEDPAALTAEHLEMLKGDVLFLEDEPIGIPSLEFMSTPGHTPGHTAYVVENAGDRIIVLGDAFHSSFELLRPELAFIDDVDPNASTATKARLRAKLARPDTRFLAGHFTDSAIGRISDFVGELTTSGREVRDGAANRADVTGRQT